MPVSSRTAAVRVLVVDDEDEIRSGVASFLAEIGYNVEEAAGGRAALARAVSNPPDAALLDVVLPDLDGIDLCRALREWPGTAAVPSIIVTVRSETEIYQAAAAEGAVGLLPKPFRLAALADRLRGALSTPAHAPAPPRSVRLDWLDAPRPGAPGLWRIRPTGAWNLEAARWATRLAVVLARRAPAACEIDVAGTKVTAGAAAVLAGSIERGLPATVRGLDEAAGEEGAVDRLRRTDRPQFESCRLEFREAGRVGLLTICGRLDAREARCLAAELRFVSIFQPAIVVDAGRVEADAGGVEALARALVGAWVEGRGRTAYHLVPPAGASAEIAPLLPPAVRLQADVAAALRSLGAPPNGRPPPIGPRPAARPLATASRYL